MAGYESWAPHMGADRKAVHALCLRCLSTCACVKEAQAGLNVQNISNMRLWQDAPAVSCNVVDCRQPERDASLGTIHER